MDLGLGLHLPHGFVIAPADWQSVFSIGKPCLQSTDGTRTRTAGDTGPTAVVSSTPSFSCIFGR